MRTPRRRTSLSINVHAGSVPGARVTRSVPATPQTELVEHECSAAVTSRRKAADASAQWLAAANPDATALSNAAMEPAPESLLTATSNTGFIPNATKGLLHEPHQLQSSEKQRALLLQTRSVDVPAARILHMKGIEACAEVVPQQQAVSGSSLPDLEPPTPSPQPRSYTRTDCELQHTQPLTPAQVLKVSMSRIRYQGLVSTLA